MCAIWLEGEVTYPCGHVVKHSYRTLVQLKGCKLSPCTTVSTYTPGRTVSFPCSTCQSNGSYYWEEGWNAWVKKQVSFANTG
ncbi:hypothetical protein GE21DRAFT_1292061 [Neurospora crassa]|nr:hypothetical protein GE21DRAFT_1292061 [Neurospora crassa]